MRRQRRQWSAADILGTAVSGDKDTADGSAAVLSGGDIAVFSGDSQGLGQCGVRLLANGCKKTIHIQVRLGTGDGMLQKQAGQGTVPGFPEPRCGSPEGL